MRKYLTIAPLRQLDIKLRKSARAKAYVGSDKVGARVQLDLLKMEGCQPTSRVLEIGCGHLHLAVLLVRYLDKGNYVGIDPNIWLREEALKNQTIEKLIKEKQSVFLSNYNFDASELGRKFDIIFSHSILSHAAYYQLEQYLQNSLKVLAPNGKIIASLRLAEGNPYGSPGSSNKQDTMDKEWVYPGVSFFTRNTVIKTAAKLNLTAEEHPEYTQYYSKKRPNSHHDWFVFKINK